MSDLAEVQGSDCDEGNDGFFWWGSDLEKNLGNQLQQPTGSGPYCVGGDSSQGE